MTIRKVRRRGETRLVIDIVYKRRDGSQGRYCHDAQVQTMAAARAEERRLLATLVQFGAPFAPPPEPPRIEEKTRLTFEEAAELFRKGKAIIKLKPSSRHGYEEIFRTRLLGRFGDRPLDALGFEDIAVLDAEMVEEALSASRRRNVVIVRPLDPPWRPRSRSASRDAQAPRAAEEGHEGGHRDPKEWA
jgi:hypothetical protein